MVSGWKTENRLTLWPQPFTSETYSCRCVLFGLVCQVKIAVLPTVVRVSNFRRGRRNSKLFALCRCIEILLKFTDFPWCFFHAFITTLKINKEEKASIPMCSQLLGKRMFSWVALVSQCSWLDMRANRGNYKSPVFPLQILIIDLNEIVGLVPKPSYRK